MLLYLNIYAGVVTTGIFMIEAVSGRNNNNTSAYSLGGLGAGALAGGTFGYLQKPWAKDGEVSDTFIRQFENNYIKHEQTQFEKTLRDIKKVSETGKLEGISEITKKLLEESEINKELSPEDIKNRTSKILNNTISGHDALDIDECIKTVNKSLKNDTLDNAVKKAKKWNNLNVTADMTDDALKQVLKDNADLFKIKPELGKTIEEAVDTYFTNNGGKENITFFIEMDKKIAKLDLEKHLEDIIDTIGEHLDIKEKRMLDLASDAEIEDKALHGVVKKTVRQMNWKNAGKWAAITGAALGAIGLAAGIIKDKKHS